MRTQLGIAATVAELLMLASLARGLDPAPPPPQCPQCTATDQCFSRTSQFVNSIVTRYVFAGRAPAGCGRGHPGTFTLPAAKMQEWAARETRWRNTGPLRILSPKGTENAYALTMDQIMAATKVRFVPSFASVRDIPSILLDSLTHNSSVNGATYDAVVYASSSLGDLARGGALVDIQPYIKNDPKQVVAIPFLEFPLIIYVNWPLLTSAPYNISQPVVGEAGRLSFYPDTWQGLISVMRQVNATASDPVTGKPRHALCLPTEQSVLFLIHAVMASIMQTVGPTQGWLYDPLTLEPLTNNTAMQQVLQLVADLTPFLRTFAAPSFIDMAQCAIAINDAEVFKALHQIGINYVYRGQLTMSILPGSTEVLDRSTMQLVPCRQDLCNSRRTTQRASQHKGGAHWPRPQSAPQTAQGPQLPHSLCAVQLLLQTPGIGLAPMQETGLRDYEYGDILRPDLSSWRRNGYLDADVLASHGPCTPDDFATAMHAMTISLRALRDSLGTTAFREQLWGTTGFVPPPQPPAPPSPPHPPPSTGSPGLSPHVLATVIAVPVGVCSLLLLLLAVIITNLRRNAKLQRSLLGHVLPPAAGDKATLVITDVQGSSKLWETLPAVVVEASMKLHDDLVRRLALESSGYEWATEGDSFLLCFHSPQAAITFATQLQDALLRCSQWPVELAAEGSPGQPLCLAPVWPGSNVTGTIVSYSTGSSSTLSQPVLAALALRRSTAMSVGPAKGTSTVRHTAVSTERLSLEVSVMAAAGTTAAVGHGSCEQEQEEQPTQCMNPIFVPISSHAGCPVACDRQSATLPPATTDASASLAHILPLPRPRSAKRLGLRLPTFALPPPKLRATTANGVEDGQGLLGLLTRQPGKEVSNTTFSFCEEEDGMKQASVSDHKESPEQWQPRLDQVRVSWQRLCELYKEVEVEAPAALTVLAGLRVRVGLHTGLAADEVMVQRRMGASSITYGGAALVLAKAVQLPVEELRAAGISVVHMGQHLVALGEGKGAMALELYCACLNTPDHAHRLWAMGPLRTLRQLQPGVLHAPVRAAAVAFMSVVGLPQLKAWSAELAQECVALYQAAAQRLLLHVSGPQLPAGYWVSSAEEEGMVLAAFPCSLQCLHWALLTLTTCMDMDWPQALLDSASGEEVVIAQAGPSWAADPDSTAAADPPLSAAGEAGDPGASHKTSLRLLRGLRIKAGVDAGEVACDLTPANGRFNYRGRCLNRAARINGLAVSGQVWCSETAWASTLAALHPVTTTKEARALASLAADQPAPSTASWSAQGSKQGKQEAALMTGPTREAAVLDVSSSPPRQPCSSGTVSSVTAQWHAALQQLHSSTQAGSGAGGEGAERPSASLFSQGQPLCLPGLLPPLVARPLGKRELRGIPGQVALLQVALAPHTSRAQLEAADRLGLSAPGLQLSRPQQQADT
ncbi:hypothetical protein QJQ45_007953 [Haematococcus lacustris]|nr:hypothetical protein QJQ45_007953 [Haematococcus lacustris]